MKSVTEKRLLRIYNRMYDAYGPQDWWPADSAFEVMLGAILTQNTSWHNVEKAIKNIKDAGLLNVRKLACVPLNRLKKLIKPSGFYNIKALRLKNFMGFLKKMYGYSLNKMRKVETDILRNELLSISGIGKETADSILLYAFERSVFVIDAYTKRILYRHGLVGKDAEYDRVQGIFTENLKRDTGLYNEFHALIVRTAKEKCKSRAPDCKTCPLNGV